MKKFHGVAVWIWIVGALVTTVGLGAWSQIRTNPAVIAPVDSALDRSVALKQCREQVRQEAIACIPVMLAYAMQGQMVASIENELKKTSGAGPAQLLVLKLSDSKKEMDKDFSDCCDRLRLLKKIEATLVAAGETDPRFFYWDSMEKFSIKLYGAAYGAERFESILGYGSQTYKNRIAEWNRLKFMCETKDLESIMSMPILDYLE